MTTPTVLVTGASGDIGRAVVAAFLTSGAQVLAHSHRRCAELSGQWPQLPLIQADLTSADGIAALGGFAERHCAELDVLVNCLGGARPARHTELDRDTWHHAVALNLDAPFFVLQRLLPLLAPGRGAVVNISSVAALTGGAFGPHYAATKAGVIGLTRSAARELGPSGIRVNCVAPGPVRSAMTDALAPHIMGAILDATALGRVVEPAEVAAAVLFLAGATAVTGQTLVIDAGRHLH